MSGFVDLQLVEPLRHALKKQGYREPTPIQRRAIPAILAGRDLLGVAQTGTGKTAAFALPLLQHIAHERAESPRPIRALILSPTRELATQIAKSFERYGLFLDIEAYAIYGGVPEGPQIRACERGVDVLVATPGRLLELCRKGRLSLDRVGFLVLDEADRLLDMGFARELRAVINQLPSKRQNLLFSATMPEPIRRLAAQLLRDPLTLEIGHQAPVTEATQQVMYLARLDKIHLLTHLVTTLEIDRALVFTRTKRGADRVCTLLQRAGLSAGAIHGDLSQAQRTTALEAFRDRATPVLVATDVAARGIDIDGISHVFHYDLPNEPETYVHRVGRTARAGSGGLAIAFCDDTEGGLLRDIERFLGTHLVPNFAQPWHSHSALPDKDATGAKRGGRQRTKRRR